MQLVVLLGCWLGPGLGAERTGGVLVFTPPPHELSNTGRRRFSGPGDRGQPLKPTEAGVTTGNTVPRWFTVAPTRTLTSGTTRHCSFRWGQERREAGEEGEWGRASINSASVSSAPTSRGLRYAIGLLPLEVRSNIMRQNRPGLAG